MRTKQKTVNKSVSQRIKKNKIKIELWDDKNEVKIAWMNYIRGGKYDNKKIDKGSQNT